MMLLINVSCGTKDSLTFTLKPCLKVRNMVSRMPEVRVNHDEVCQGCASGKKVKEPFPSSRSKTNGILQLINFDLCEPMPVTSLGGYLYYIIFVRDFSAKTWTFFLKHKDQAFHMSKDFKALVENQTRKKIKVFKSDKGGEFTSNEFTDFCKKAGINKDMTIPYNPEQNGVVERKNKIIMEAAKAMLHEQKLPKFLWGEVVNIALYVQNKTPHQALGDKIPEEAFKV